jgi:hypothetical protein
MDDAPWGLSRLYIPEKSRYPSNSGPELEVYIFAALSIHEEKKVVIKESTSAYNIRRYIYIYRIKNI